MCMMCVPINDHFWSPSSSPGYPHNSMMDGKEEKKPRVNNYIQNISNETTPVEETKIVSQRDMAPTSGQVMSETVFCVSPDCCMLSRMPSRTCTRERKKETDMRKMLPLSVFYLYCDFEEVAVPRYPS
ncbi:uncharacterized protein UV8b_06260 [Ustilaginoidea virens]|uniref:Uncharacterized protein n=1 Tax=Ustilaginoidea virens TaxID=1159556 RepID=A0A8E5HVJ7_USTVR|nr:uncharacterized protein UV8b_06260 [Ustilaginoidea virens]QUC22019.1 hypothetical protein UV8b_06260 [Ustilaginoidea virens]